MQFINIYDIINYAKLIGALREKIVSIYKSDYAIHTLGLSDEEIISVMSLMPNSSFMDDNSTFETNLKARTDAKKKEQKKYQLKKLWNDLTGYDSPQKWSEAHLTPISVLVDETDTDKANKLFRVFTDNSADAKTIEQSLVYLENKPVFIARMDNLDEIEDAFRAKILGRYSTVICDLNDVKDYIQSRCTTPIYDWYGSPSVQKKVAEYASSVYRTSANSGVMQRIDDMSPDEAKAYLKRLVKDDVEVGISIINSEGGE